MKLIRRPYSILTNKTNLEPLHRLTRFPVFIGCTESAPQEDLFSDLDWYICPESGFIQLLDLVPEDIIYSGYHSEAVGKIWEQHHAQFAAFCNKHAGIEILEIGGSNGKLAGAFFENEANKKKSWDIVEPNPSINGSQNVRIIQAFFEEAELDKSYDTVIHSHSLEHSFDPNIFLQKIRSILNNGEKQIFSIPNLLKYVENKFTNAINFEHSYLLTEALAEELLTKHGFKIHEKQYYEEHSIFFAAEKVNIENQYVPGNFYYQYKSTYLDFVEYYEKEISRINTIIKNCDTPLYLFGAHVFSQFLIHQGLDTRNLACILDNSPSKTGKRLYGSDFSVATPDKITSDLSPTVILKAGQYQNEIRAQLKQLNPNVTIVE